jgi:TetR/AcrR family transcriptional repressor of nem operon
MKEQILELAQIQMKSGGYDNLNFAKIAESLSTTRANLHYHFKNKESLAIEATQFYIQQSFDEMKVIAQKNQGDFPGFLKGLENHFIKELTENDKCCGCVCAQIVQDKEAPDSLVKLATAHFEEMISMLKMMIEQSQEKGILQQSFDAERMATFCGSIMMGMSQLGMIYGKDKDFIKRIEGSLTEWIERYK